MKRFNIDGATTVGDASAIKHYDLPIKKINLSDTRKSVAVLLFAQQDDAIVELATSYMQNILDNLWQGMKTEKAPPGTSPKEILHKHLDDYIHGVPAVSDASFRSGSTLIDDGFSLILFLFYSPLSQRIS